MVMAEGDASELAHALGIAAKARGMSDVAKAAGITREALYKALRPHAITGRAQANVGKYRSMDVSKSNGRYRNQQPV
jgi:probable addiction module antidote protein